MRLMESAITGAAKSLRWEIAMIVDTSIVM